MKLSGNPLILFSMRFPAIVLCLLIAAPSAHSYNRLDAIKSLQTVVPNWESVEVTFWINDLRESDDPVVKLGQSVHLNMQAGAPAHYLVVLIDAKGETTIFAGDADSAATRRLQIPNDGSSVGFEQGAPVGDQNIFVFASNSAFMMPDLGLNSDERIVTLPRTIAALDDFSTMLNRHASLNMLAMAQHEGAAAEPQNRWSNGGAGRATSTETAGKYNEARAGRSRSRPAESAATGTITRHKVSVQLC